MFETLHPPFSISLCHFKALASPFDQRYISAHINTATVICNPTHWISECGFRIADLKTKRQESGGRSYEAEVRGRKSEIRDQTTEDKEDLNEWKRGSEFSITDF